MSDDENLQHCLSDSLLGERLSEEHRALLLGTGTCESVPAGSVVFSEGDPAHELRIICSGSIALDMHVPLRGSTRILTLGPRDVLGWSALVGDGTMSATAIVLDDAVMLCLPADQLRELCDQDAELGRGIMERMARALARRLKATRLQLLDLFSETEGIQF